MYQRKLDAIYSQENRILWYLLVIQAAYINVGGFLTGHQFVSHTTGFAGNFALSFFDSNLSHALFFFFVPLAFLSGSFFSAIFTEVRRIQGKMPVYNVSMMIIALIYLLTAITGELGFWGQFNKHGPLYKSYFLLTFLSFSCGAQNSLFTSVSQAVVRTTHLTGLTTDLGIDLAKSFFKISGPKERQNIELRIGIILSFLIGSLLGAYCFKSFQYKGFYLSALLSFLVSIKLTKDQNQMKAHYQEIT